ncbi:extracellular solute-binding protein [Vibrio sp. SCSIO 43137]|uniref:extracellular solute-binding protein n=1 Tax=Vibrio sp. SCSIO 43137 TaxID=3021011 RepID=UPI00230744D3|nr:extracellular solute-binding protein [Vibrio sp. SCSIO 43137]WCE30795.1 extracellular solute-binding protein [Vibrio sp. SCSIO 43137]
MKQQLLSISVIAAMGLAFSANASASTIEVSHFFSGCSAKWAANADLEAARGQGECAIVNALINSYNKTNKDGVEVKYKALPENTYYDSYRASFATGDQPDISIMHSSVMPGYVKRKLITSVEPVIQGAAIDKKDFFNTVKESVSYNGDMYAIPFDSHSLLWHVNVDLFEKAGLINDLGEPIMPHSRKELLEQAKLIKEKTGKDYITMSMNDVNMSNPVWFWQSLVGQQGGHYTNNSNDKATFSTPEGQEALSLIKELVDKGYVKPYTEYNASEQAFLNGEAAVFANGTWVVDYYNSQTKKDGALLKQYSAQAFPKIYNKDGVWQDNHNWVVSSKKGRTNEQSKAIGSFLEYLSDNSNYWATTGHMPVRESIAMSDFVLKLPQRTQYLKNITSGIPVPPIQNGRAFLEVARDEFKSAWLTDKPVKETLESAEKRANRVMNR